MNKKKIRRH